MIRSVTRERDWNQYHWLGLGKRAGREENEQDATERTLRRRGSGTD